MNVICNNCAGGYFYRDVLKSEYSNPFIWTQIAAKEFLKLIEKFDEINFYNYEMLKMQKSDFTDNGDFGEHTWLNQHPLGLRIDNVFTLWFSHILYKKDAITPQMISTNVYYKRHFELVIKTFHKRLARMTEPPVFFILDYAWFGWTYDLIRKAIDLSEKTKYKIVILTNRKIDNSKKAKIIFDEHLHTHPSVAVVDHGNELKEAFT